MRARAWGRRWFLPLILGLVLLGAPLPLEAESPRSSSPAPPQLTLRSLKIVGNKIVPLKELKKELSIKLPSFWPPWAKAPAFREADLEYDVERLKMFYRRQGFFHAEIVPEIGYEAGGQVDVRLVIEEGPWIKVMDVEVKVLGGPDLSALKKKWTLKPGDRYTEKTYDGLKNLYLNYLPNQGYPRVRVTGQVLLDDEENTAKIKLTIDPGTLSYFGSIKLINPEKLETPEQAILEKVTFKTGEVFKLEELFKTQRRLYATDLFRSVVLTPDIVAAQKRDIPITIEIEEKKKRSLKMGLGYGDEDKFRVRMGFRWRNLWGGGRVLDVDTKYSSLGFKVEELFTNPVLWGTRFDLVNQTGARHRDLPGFTDNSYYTQTRLERDLPMDFRFYVGHGLEFARPFDIPLDTLLLLAGTEKEKVYRASFLVLGVRRDTVDSHIEPKRGGTLTFANEFAPTFFGSGLQFLQTVVDARRYQAIGDWGFVLAGRVRFGLIDPIQNTDLIPIYRRFFSGGATSVRGYKLDFLGPRNAAGNPIGGDAVVEASIEGRFPLPFFKKIGGVVFLDAGNVYFRIKNLDLGQLKYSPGVGLRYLSPIGPVGLDIAFPTNRIDYRRDSPYQIHFTIGYGF